MKLFRVKLNSGGYISGGSLQSTKDRYLALSSEQRALRNLDLCDNQGVIESVEVSLKECKVGTLGFGFGDTYSLESATGAIIHETAKYVYTIRLNADGSMVFGSCEKHKREHAETRCFTTGKGFSLNV